MDDWIDVAAASDFPANSFRTLLLHNTPVAVFNVAGAYYAIEDCCSHEAETLSNGTVDGLEITCPLHLARFSLSTGAALAPPAYEAIATFPVRVAGGMVQIRDARGDPVDTDSG